MIQVYLTLVYRPCLSCPETRPSTRKSIALSSTCIKALSEMTLPSDSAVDLEEVANDSVAMKDV